MDCIPGCREQINLNSLCSTVFDSIHNSFFDEWSSDSPAFLVLCFQMETDFYVLAELIKDYLGLVHSVKVSQEIF